MNRGIMCMRVAMLAAIFCGSSLTCFNQVKESELKRFVDGGY